MAKRSQHRVSGGPEPVANVRRQGMGSPERAAKKGAGFAEHRHRLPTCATGSGAAPSVRPRRAQEAGREDTQVENLCYLGGEGGLEVEQLDVGAHEPGPDLLDAGEVGREILLVVVAEDRADGRIPALTFEHLQGAEQVGP